MSIVKAQIDKITSQLSLLQFKDGVPPNFSFIRQKIKEIMGNKKGQPTVNYKEQKRKQVFDIDHYNDFYTRLQFDLEIAYGEISNIVLDSLIKLNTFELSYRAQSHQLNHIIDYLDNLLFVIDNANGNFYGVFENFSSTEKTNLSESTPKIVNVQERCISLPFNNMSGYKIPMNHLYETVSWPLIISRDTVYAETYTDGKFGNAFSDIYSSWTCQIATEQPGPLTVQLDIPLSNEADIPGEITRIQLIPHSIRPTRVRLQYTQDGINYIVFPSIPQDISLEEEALVYNFDFASTQAIKVRMILEKEEHDEEDELGNHIYYIGFKHIGFYGLGSALEATYISKPLKPVGLERPIDSVSLSVSEQIPARCSVEYFVALADNDDEKIGDWQLINPINRSNSFAGEKVINFNNLGSKTKNIHSPSTNSVYETHRGIDFYRLPTGLDAQDTSVFGLSELYRGFNSWNKNTNEELVLRQVKDSYISFNPGDVQDIYAVITETAAVDSGFQTFPGGGVGTEPVTKFTVSNPINYNIQTMSLVPDPDINPIVDQRPNYAVYEVKRFGSNMNITGEIINLTGETVANFANDVSSNPENEPIVLNTSTNIAYIRDQHYALVENADGVLNGIRRLPNFGNLTDSGITDGENVSVSYRINSNITQQVDAIRDNVVYMKSLLNLAQDDRVEVAYRFVPKGKNAIIRPTLKVTSRFGDSDEGQNYNQGPDYAVNINQGKITRIPQGNIIPNEGDLAVYVDFYYKETPTNLHTYSTWVYQPKIDPVKIEFNDINLDLDSGEQFIINSTSFTVDLSNSNETPFLPKGWHQIVVKSKDPAIFSNAAINKVAELKDIENDYVIIGGGKYFSDIQAIRNSMAEVTYDFLKNSVLPSEHDRFAIENNKILLNFKPGNTDDFYSYRPQSDTSGAITGFAVENTEDFLLKYKYRVPSDVTADKLLVKIDLKKDKTSDGGITPKVFRYNARIK